MVNPSPISASTYLDYFGLSTGYMLSFNFNREKEQGVHQGKEGVANSCAGGVELYYGADDGSDDKIVDITQHGTMCGRKEATTGRSTQYAHPRLISTVFDKNIRLNAEKTKLYVD